MNPNGFPNNKDNWHKLKEVQTLTINKEAVIILETGTNKKIAY